MSEYTALIYGYLECQTKIALGDKHSGKLTLVYGTWEEYGFSV